MAKVFLIEDDLELAKSVVNWLGGELHLVEHCANGQAGLERLQGENFEAVILDIGLPDLDGFELCRQYREGGGAAPILMLTGKDHINDKVAGLKLGADDYLTKPFSARELSARLEALLRRAPALREQKITLGQIVIDFSRHQVLRNGQSVELLPVDQALLEFLANNKGQIFSSEALLERLWAKEQCPTENAVRSSIKRIRQKLDDDGAPSIIETLSKVGYRIRIS